MARYKLYRDHIDDRTKEKRKKKKFCLSVATFKKSSTLNEEDNISYPHSIELRVDIPPFHLFRQGSRWQFLDQVLPPCWFFCIWQRDR